MKTLGQILMDAFAKADTIETVALDGKKLKITHKPNANEQIEAAFSDELEAYMDERMATVRSRDITRITLGIHAQKNT